MSYKNLISALVFAAFGFCLSEAAKAQDCDNPDFCFDFGFPSTIDNFTGSRVACDLNSGGNILDVDISNLGKAGAANFIKTGTADCTYCPNAGPGDTCEPGDGNLSLGSCAFELTMTGVTASTCKQNSFTVGAFCQDKTLAVTGTLTCPSHGVMQLGIAGMARNRNNCETVFPSGDETGLPAGKVLEFSVTTDGSSCTGPFKAISNVKERWCNSGVDNTTGNFIDSAVDCTPPSGNIRASTQVAVSVVPFDLNVRQSINTSDCTGGGNLDRGKANIDIFGSNTFNVSNIDQSKNLPLAQTLQCEGAPLVCGTATDLNGDGFLDLPCQVATCPTFGPALADPNATTVAVTCTGQLKSGTQILGTDPSVKIN